MGLVLAGWKWKWWTVNEWPPLWLDNHPHPPNLLPFQEKVRVRAMLYFWQGCRGHLNSREWEDNTIFHLFHVNPTLIMCSNLPYRFCLINAGVLYVYHGNFQKVDDEEYGGVWELTKEGFMTSFASFLVSSFEKELTFIMLGQSEVWYFQTWLLSHQNDDIWILLLFSLK